jgi:hypothetical protein
MSSINSKASLDTISLYNNWLKTLELDLGSQLNSDQQKQAKASFYAMVYDSLETD